MTQSTRAPEAVTRPSYFERSIFINVPNSSGVLGTGSASRVAKRVLVSGALSAATKAWLSRVSTSLGVAAGATKPHQVSIANPLRVSATGGTPGKALTGFNVVTARALSLHDRILGAAVARLSKLKST